MQSTLNKSDSLTIMSVSKEFNYRKNQESFQSLYKEIGPENLRQSHSRTPNGKNEIMPWGINLLDFCHLYGS